MKSLKEDGVPEAMVEAFVEALRESLSQVATKEDVQTGLAGVESRVMGEIRQSESRVMIELANVRTDLHRTLRVHLVAMTALGVAFFGALVALLRG